MAFTNDFAAPLIVDSLSNRNSLTEIDITVCQRTQENPESCWQNLVHQLMDQLNQTQSRYQELAQKYNQLAENLAESEARNRALTEAAAAQAKQFSQTLKQLRQNQLQVVQSEKMASLGQLVAGVAHEINNPVNFIYGNLAHATEYTQNLMDLLQLYQRYYPQPVPEIVDAAAAMELDFLEEDLPKLLNSMRMGAERIQKIVLSLRNFSRMDEAELKKVDIHEGIESSLMILQNRLKAKSDRSEIVVLREYSSIPQVECYAGQLNQVFMNVLVNAVDALEESTLKRDGQPSQDFPCQITIRTSLNTEGWVKIVIADNGPGMSEDVRQRIFDPFFTTKPVGKGTGLGMSISYQIITEKHGGTLECISTPGIGTEFIIQLPIQH